MWTFNDQSIVKKNHMDILWHKYADKSEEKTIVDADLPAKASVVGSWTYDVVMWDRCLACAQFHE